MTAIEPDPARVSELEAALRAERPDRHAMALGMLMSVVGSLASEHAGCRRKPGHGDGECRLCYHIADGLAVIAAMGKIRADEVAEAAKRREEMRRENPDLYERIYSRAPSGRYS